MNKPLLSFISFLLLCSLSCSNNHISYNPNQEQETCIAGQSCTPAQSCHIGITSCTSGASLCIDSGMHAIDGTSCGINLICITGDCEANTDQTIDPGNPEVPTELNGQYERYKDWPENYGDALIAAWDGDRVASFAFTIDDNHGQDVDWWLAKGEEYNFKFTWFLIVDNIVDYVTVAVGGYWDQYIQAYQAGHDIQSHTYSHLSELAAGNITIEQEYGDAITEIESRIPGAQVETLAHVGGTNKDLNDIDLSMTYYIGGRGTVNHINNKSFDYTNTKAISSVANIFNPDTQWIYIPRLFDHEDIRFRGFFCMYYHGISIPAADAEDTMSDTEEILQYCDENRDELWVTWFRNIIKYARERDTVEAQNGLSSTATADHIEITVSTNGQLDARFNYPLTIKVKVNENWQQYTVTQDDIPVDATLMKYDDNYFIYFKAIPDNGLVVLQRY